MKLRFRIPFMLTALLFLSLGCSLLSSFPQAASPSAAAPADSPTPAAAVATDVPGGPVPAAAETATPPALVATLAATTHLVTPGVPGGASPFYDVDSSDTGAEHRAPYGDSYNIELFERPFTQSVMTYLPAVDITTFSISQDDQWYYVSFDLDGGDMNDPLGIDYGVELDTDHDGFGDMLVWAKPPYTPEWLAETVQVYTDTNHDTGGLSAEKSDAVFDGNGYDKVIFDRGQGDDPDLAWVRLNPEVSAAIQFAFKRSLAGNAFMWGVWADAGLRDPAQFNYNDRFKETDAGSPEKNENYYPIKAISQVDNTCWRPVGFEPTDEQPHLCPTQQPPKPRHKAQPTPFPSRVP